jgi:hypothetical protein
MGQEVRAVLGTVQGGMDESVDAIILPETKYARGVNLSIRGGFAKTRPAFVHQDISGMPTGTYQGSGVWKLDGGDWFVFVVSGAVYALKIDTMALTAVSGGPHLDTSAQCYFAQADRYMVIQDGNNTPVILKESGGVVSRFEYSTDASYGDSLNDGYDEGTDIDFVASQQVPIGTVMGYVMGRLHVSPKYIPGTTKTGRPYFISGDIVKPSFPEDCLRFKETQYFTGGGAHGMPVEMGYVNGMALFRNSQQGTGSGDLYVFGRNGLAAFAVSVPRASWTDRTIAQGLFVGSGTKSPWAVTEVNNDIVFRGLDGLRMMSYTTSQQWRTGSLFNSPISEEVARYMDDKDYLEYVSTAMYDNQLLSTCDGVSTRYFKGMVHMDVSPTVNLGSSTTGPAYSGVWTGANFAQVLSARKDGEPRQFVFAQGPKLYLVDKEVDADTDSSGVDSPIESRIETRAYHFGNFTERKKLRHVDLWLSDLTRDTTVTIYARPYGYPYWAELSSKALLVGESGAAQMRHRLRFGIDSALDLCDTISSRPLYNGPEFEFAIAWTGHLQLDRAVFTAEVVGEEPPNPCDETTEVTLTAGVSTGVELTDFTYSID